MQIYEILCQAGIPSDQLKLALEPEAAAIYVMKEAKTVFGKESVTTFNPGTKIMVADLGGKFNLITTVFDKFWYNQQVSFKFYYTLVHL